MHRIHPGKSNSSKVQKIPQQLEAKCLFSAKCRYSCLTSKLRYISVVTYFATLIGYFVSVENRYTCPPYLRMIMFGTSSTFMTFACINLVTVMKIKYLSKFKEPSPPLNLESGINVSSNVEKQGSIVKMLMIINLLTGVSHFIIGMNKSPVIRGNAHSGAFGVEYMVPCVRLINWICIIPLVIILLQSFCLSVNFQDKRKIDTLRWIFFHKDGIPWRTVITLTISTILGSLPNMTHMSSIGIYICLFISLCFFLDIVNVAKNIEEEIGIVDSNKRFRDEDTVYFGMHAKYYVMMMYVCVLCLTCVVGIHICGIFGVFNSHVGVALQSIFEVFTKGVYTLVIGNEYTEMLSPTIILKQLLDIERKSTEHRRNFLRYIMHEVRVPLNTIHLGVGVIVENVMPEKKEETLEIYEHIRNGIEGMTGILDSTLSLSAIEENRFVLNYVHFDPNTSFKLISDMFDINAKKKNISLVYKLHSTENIPKLCGDARRLNEVTSNFLSNAIKFSRENSNIYFNVYISKKQNKPLKSPKHLTQLRQFTHYQSNKSFQGNKSFGNDFKQANTTWELRVEVVDAGVGIRQEEKVKLFEPFSQITPERLQEGKGSGLGLVISKRIIELHGGEIGFHSEYGKGSTFYFKVELQEVCEDLQERNMDN